MLQKNLAHSTIFAWHTKKCGKFSAHLTQIFVAIVGGGGGGGGVGRLYFEFIHIAL